MFSPFRLGRVPLREISPNGASGACFPPLRWWLLSGWCSAVQHTPLADPSSLVYFGVLEAFPGLVWAHRVPSLSIFIDLAKLPTSHPSPFLVDCSNPNLRSFRRENWFPDRIPEGMRRKGTMVPSTLVCYYNLPSSTSSHTNAQTGPPLSADEPGTLLQS